MNNLSFEGSVSILLYCMNSTRILKFHSLGLVFGLANMKLESLDSEGNFREALRLQRMYSEAEENYTQMVTVVLERSLQAGMQYLFSISMYTGLIRLDAKGFYLSTYRTNLGRRRYSVQLWNTKDYGNIFFRFLAATQFEVTEARRAFPCLDEPRFKANFSVTIIRRISMISLSNMERVDSINRSPNFQMLLKTGQVLKAR